jgi:hypothetical protein
VSCVIIRNRPAELTRVVSESVLSKILCLLLGRKTTRAHIGYPMFFACEEMGKETHYSLYKSLIFGGL